MTRYTIIKDGYPFIFTGLAATILVGFLADPAFAGIPLILTIYFAYFFREPDRPLPDDPHVLYSRLMGLSWLSRNSLMTNFFMRKQRR